MNADDIKKEKSVENILFKFVFSIQLYNRITYKLQVLTKEHFQKYAILLEFPFFFENNFDDEMILLKASISKVCDFRIYHVWFLTYHQYFYEEYPYPYRRILKLNNHCVLSI